MTFADAGVVGGAGAALAVSAGGAGGALSAGAGDAEAAGAALGASLAEGAGGVAGGGASPPPHACSARGRVTAKANAASLRAEDEGMRREGDMGYSLKLNGGLNGKRK